MQDAGKILPLFLNADSAYANLKPEEGAFIKGMSWDISANPEQGIGTGNASGEGQNLFILTPTRSNAALSADFLPTVGWNRNLGEFESINTNEVYAFNYNSEGRHCIYLINGDTGLTTKVIEDPKLAFTDDPEGNIANCRVSLRFVKDKDGNIIEKHLFWTDGKKWQGWINVIAAIGSDGFNESTFPYWKLTPPHFDREELLEWPLRPCMIKPLVSSIPNTADDLGKINRLVDKAFQFAIARVTTDNRTTPLSPYSLPLEIKSEEFLNNPDSIPKNASITMDAGSPLTEKILLFVRRAGTKNTLDSISVWGDWILYDTLDKFDIPPTGAYWTRTNPWSAFTYDPILNTIQYRFDNSKVGTIVSQADANMLQTGMAQLSIGLTDVDDAVLLIDNRYDYDNFPKSLLDKITAQVIEKESQVCSRPLRTVYLYAYVGQCYPDFSYVSQVGYKYGDDTQVRFGGLRMSSLQPASTININESKFFQLDFADKDAFRVYLKGTPYFADGEWCVVKSDNTIEPIGDIYDFKNSDILTNVQNIFKAGSYFICRFKLTVPAGRYIAAMGRHNVVSAGDYRNTSTYVYGIANSRVKSITNLGFGNTLVSIKPNAIGSFSKEMEIDCSAADVDVWGNNADTFYIYAPYNQFSSGQGRFRFIEGYFQQSSSNPVPIELFPYQMTSNNADDWGKFTDKNGFYWAYTKTQDSDNTNIQFVAKVNCAYPNSFVIPTSQAGIGYMKNAIAYLSDHNGSGDCNHIVFTGRVTDQTGNIGYQNISISMKDGPTVLTRPDGTFTMIVHNGQNTPRSSNVYVNAAGNFIITIANCGQLPLTNFSEILVACVNCQERIYPIPLNMQVDIQNPSQVSVKQGGKYNIGLVGADLAGRLMYVNVVTDIEVATFLERNNINATFFRLLLLAQLQLTSVNPDIKWISPYVSKNVISRRYVEWVGDSMTYLDNSGNVIDDPANASFIKISIQSLLDANVRSNFSLLATYQFVKEDRLRVYDNGDGLLFDTGTFGDPIDVQVLGTNYNQAAINSGLLLPQSPTVLDNNIDPTSDEVGIIVRYDTRLDKLFRKSGFWIEIYSPIQENDNIPFQEVAGFYPVIQGEIAIFTGYNNGVPVYDFPTQIDMDYWDTYYLQRNISGKYFNHPFESPNVTDNWGANITSGGRLNVENKNAKQFWLGGDVARSDSFMKNGFNNGLAMFRRENRKNYGIYPFGEIRAAITRRNTIAFICANDWFTVNYNMPYTRVGKDGNLVLTNLDENLSLPNPKTGGMFGIEKAHLRSLVVDEDFFFWYDSKNTGFMKSNYSGAIDISQQIADERGGIQSYLNAKAKFMGDWNNSHDRGSLFDVIGGIDNERGNIYLSFRPRRQNTNHLSSYVNQRRNFDLKHQETFVYSIQYKGWLPCANFTPEGFARLRGSWANVEFICFAAGKPYIHNNTPNNSFLNFFGQQCEPTVIGVFNKGDNVKIAGSLSQDINGSKLFVDMVYDTQQNSFSYIPANLWSEKEKRFYGALLRDMCSYPDPDPEQLFRSMLYDGKRIFSPYFICRFVQKYGDLGKYFQLNGLSYLFTDSFTTKP